MWVSHTPLCIQVSHLLLPYVPGVYSSLCPTRTSFSVYVSSTWQAFPLMCLGRDISFQHAFHLWLFYVLGASIFNFLFSGLSIFLVNVVFNFSLWTNKSLRVILLSLSITNDFHFTFTCWILCWDSRYTFNFVFWDAGLMEIGGGNGVSPFHIR